MIDQWSDDRTGWARFSDDMTMRYRLARSLSEVPLFVRGNEVELGCGRSVVRAVFLMLNPSTADGALDDRAEAVYRLLADHGVKLHHLGLTLGGAPKHPLARGKHRIPADLAPVAWEVSRG